MDILEVLLLELIRYDGIDFVPCNVVSEKNEVQYLDFPDRVRYQKLRSTSPACTLKPGLSHAFYVQVNTRMMSM
jgi:hypothetical protein